MLSAGQEDLLVVHSSKRVLADSRRSHAPPEKCSLCTTPAEGTKNALAGHSEGVSLYFVYLRVYTRTRARSDHRDGLAVPLWRAGRTRTHPKIP